jgi:hypothetical protein
MSKQSEFTFCKSTELCQDGTDTFYQTYYFTRKDGDLVSGSMSLSEEKAKDFYDKLIKLGGESKVETILESTMVETK